MSSFNANYKNIFQKSLVLRSPTFGEFLRVVAVTNVMPDKLSYTGGFHSARTALQTSNIRKYL